MAAAAFGELHAAIAKLGDWAPGCGHAWLPNSEAAKLQEAATTVFVLGQREYALLTRLAEVAEAADEALSEVNYSEPDSVWSMLNVALEQLKSVVNAST